MKTSEYLKLQLPDYTDAADIAVIVGNFETLEKHAPNWTNFSNSGTVLESTGNFRIATTFPIGQEANVFAVTVKMPRAFAENDTITVDDIAYNLYQGTDPALSDAWKANEVVTINFDKTSRRCWASAGGGAPRPLPPQISNLQASTPEGASPSIVFTWTNPVDDNFAGMILVVKEGSAPNGITDGTQVYKGTGTTFTYTEGVQWEHTYYARGFAYNSQNKFQMDASGAITSATPSDVPDAVSSASLVGNKSKATLSWTNPTQQSFQTVKVVQKIGSAPENPSDGTEIYSGTGTTVSVSNLQDGINYYFAIFAVGKNGKYKPPVVKEYTPQIYPKYTFTGNHKLIKDGNDHWRIKFLSSGTLNWLSDDTNIDVFCVGGGGAGQAASSNYGCGGGGGGYTKTYKAVKMSNSNQVIVEIGSGGTNRGNGGTTKFDRLYSANGGICSQGKEGGAGGSGGGGGAGANNEGSISHGGNGGSDGANGTDGTETEGTYVAKGGRGQGTTTREFGELDGELYSGGGGAGADHGWTGAYGYGGTGGQGSPKLAMNGSSDRNSMSGGSAGGGYGGGGGGGFYVSGNSGAGAQGIVIIRDARV